MPVNDSDLVAALAARNLGVPMEPGAPQGGPPPGAPPAGPQPGRPNPAMQAGGPDKDTPSDKANTAGSPSDEGDRMSAEAIAYEIEFGENDKRKLTPNQIKSTFERYRDLNYKHSSMKPVLDVAEAVLKANPGATPEALARFMIDVAKREKANPMVMGADKPGANQPGPAAKDRPSDDADLDDETLSAWERDNAASLPPGYRNMSKGQKRIEAMLAQTQQMLQAVLARSQGVADASRAAQGDLRTQQVQNIRRTIGNNLDRVQAHLQIPDDAAKDFMAFAAERGYTMEDFVDPQLTFKVMTDFKNTMNSPELDRLRSVHQRRQAFTGAMSPTPASGAGAGSPAPGATPDPFQSLLAGTMQKQGMA